MAFKHPKLELISAPLSSFVIPVPFLEGVDGQQRMVVELGGGELLTNRPNKIVSSRIARAYSGAFNPNALAMAVAFPTRKIQTAPDGPNDPFPDPLAADCRGRPPAARGGL
jgi:hypothetical protein